MSKENQDNVQPITKKPQAELEILRSENKQHTKRIQELEASVKRLEEKVRMDDVTIKVLSAKLVGGI